MIFTKQLSMKNIILGSTSTIFGGEYLEYLLGELEILFSQCDEILFIPYARPGGISHSDYTAKAIEAFSKIGKRVKGLHEFDNPKEAILSAKAIFTGGGNTFLLVTQLYKHDVLDPLRSAVINGVPYLGTSAGSNIAGISMMTTNDMPIIYPPSFETLELIPFNINPHYIDSDGSKEHMGETRETRINEFHTLNSEPVIGLREGSWLEVKGNAVILKGTLPARLFQKDEKALEIESGTDFATLI